jgi:serine/threonine protein kinase
MVAIKKPRFESEGRRDKIIHEKKIVEKFRSSVCYFLPKYYEVQKQPELSNCLLMEMLSGEELDFYVAVRSESISLWSKIYILLNVIYGMRHLAASNIVHLDLKPINVLVCKSLVAKIIDFGEAYHPDVCPKSTSPSTQITLLASPSPTSPLKSTSASSSSPSSGRTTCNTPRSKTSSPWASSCPKSSSTAASST